MTKMELATETFMKMRDYGEDSVKQLNHHMISVLKEWSDAKATYIDIDNIISEEKAIVQAAADTQINNIISELSNTFAKLEEAREQLVNTNKKVEVANTELGVLRPLPKKLETTEQKVRDLLSKIKTISTEAELEMSRHADLKKHVVVLDTRIEETMKELQSVRVQEKAAKIKIEQLEEVIVEKKEEIKEVSHNLTTLQEENTRRLHHLHHVEIQTNPLVEDCCVQTEFICPPVSNFYCGCSVYVIDVYMYTCLLTPSHCSYHRCLYAHLLK